MREPPHPLYVNWCELTIPRQATGEELYHNAWATNRPLSEATVGATARAGRARWKVENEGHNVLKRRGYYLEHNYGHGRQHLSTVLVLLLAFVCHTLLGLCDPAYQRLAAKRRHTWPRGPLIARRPAIFGIAAADGRHWTGRWRRVYNIGVKCKRRGAS